MKLQIKKVSKDKAFKYLVAKLREGKSGRAKEIGMKQLREQLEKRFKVQELQAHALAMYVMEEPDEMGQVRYEEEMKRPRQQVKKKVQEILGDYTLYNGLAMTSLLNRLTSILEDFKNGLIDKLKDADVEGTGEVTLSAFLDILR